MNINVSLTDTLIKLIVHEAENCGRSVAGHIRQVLVDRYNGRTPKPAANSNEITLTREALKTIIDGAIAEDRLRRTA